MIVLWLPSALDDLEAIRDFIARDAPGSAVVIVHRLRGAVETLREFPDTGRRGQVRGTREFVVPRMPYIVIYRRQARVVEILRVLHGAQRWPSN